MWRQSKDQWLPEVVGREKRMGEARNFKGRETPVYGSVMVDTGYCTFVKNHIMYKTKSEV